MAETTTSLTDIILTEVATALLPLSRVKTPDRALALLREIGYEFPGAQDLSNGFSAAAAAVTPVRAAVDALLSADTTEDLVAAAQPVASAVKAVVDAINDLAQSFEGILSTINNFTPEVLEDLPRRLLEYLLVVRLESALPEVYSLLVFAGIIENTQKEAVPSQFQARFVLRRINWNRVPTLFTSPGTLAKDLYGWGVAFDDKMFMDRLYLVMRAFAIPGGFYTPAPVVTGALNLQPSDPPELRLPVVTGGVWPSTYLEGGLALTVAPDPDPAFRGFAILPYIVGAAQLKVPLGDDWEFDLSSSANLSGGIALVVQPTRGLEFHADLTNPGSVVQSATFELRLSRLARESNQLILFGKPGATRLSAGTLRAALSASKKGSVEEIGFELKVEGAALVIAAGDSDAFLRRILPSDGVRVEFGLGFGWSSTKGVYFSGAAGLEATFPVKLSVLGVLELESIFLAIRASTAGLRTIVAATINAHVGPLDAAVERFGTEAKLTFPPGGGNIGPANVALGFKPPSGIGLALKTGPVKGGGYLFIDPEAGQYAGVLQLEFSAIALKAIGILTTKMPDGREGFSLLILITVEFTPIQLGFGFTLNGVGGLIGIHRDMLLTPLRDGIKHHTLDSILFPKDPVANATKIIGDLNAVFPPAQGRFTFGLMAKLGWGSPAVITAEIGIIIVLMEPIRLALLGKIRLVLPEDNEDAVVKLNLDILGTLDFAKSELGIDAVIYDSRIAIFDVRGGMALRINWGPNPVFVMSIGGFHPRFAPPPDLTPLDRLAISLATSDNPRIRLEAYLAITSNTVQLGARFDLYAEAKFLGTWSVNAYLGFDALIYLNPFHFTVDVFGGASLKHNGNPFLSLDLLLTISGPGQWVVHGQAVFNFFGRHAVAVDLVIGEPDPPTPLPLVNPLDDLKVALEDPRSWSAQLPDTGQMLVTLREIEAPDLVLVHPFGRLTVREKVVPLETTITHYGASDPGEHRHFAIDTVKLGTKTVDRGALVREQFSPGQFFTLTEDQRIAGPEFEPLPGGLTGIGVQSVSWGTVVPASFDYETLVIDVIQPAPIRQPSTVKYTPRDQVVLALAGASAAGRAPTRRDNPAEFRNKPKGIAVHDASYTIRSLDDLTKPSGTKTYGSRTEAKEALEQRADREELQLVGAHEEGG